MFTAYFPELHEMTTRVLRASRAYGRGETSPEDLASHQLHELKATLRYTRERSPFYRQKLARCDDAFIESLSIESFEQLPFTTKADLREQMGEMLSRPLDECCFFYETTGTTGAATPCPRDYVDIIHSNVAVTSCLETILKRGETRHFVGICGPTELHSFGDTLGDVCRNLGLAMAKFWAYSPVIGLKKAVETLGELGITALICTPGMALTMAKVASELGRDLKRDFGLKVLLLTGELGSPAMMKNLESLWGARAYNFLYGAQETLVLATTVHSGKMHTFPLNYYYEVIDPETGKVVPAKGGVRFGELVVTMLFQGSKPMVRYRTGDVVRLRDAAVDDQMRAPVVEVLGRVRDSLLLNGKPIQGYDLEELLMKHVSESLGYQITISNDGADRLAIQLEMLDGGARPDYARAIAAAFDGRLGIRAEVTFGPLGSIGSTGALVSWKAARIVDTREAVDAEQLTARKIAAARDSLLRTVAP